jgi:hypothetical protein
MRSYWFQFSVSKQLHKNKIFVEGILYLYNDLITTLLWKVRSRKARLTAVGIPCADHATLSTRKDWH